MVAENETKQKLLEQTETDLANAILVIQEQESQLQTNLNKPTPATQFALTDADADNNKSPAVSSNVNFGSKFPKNPQKGDMFKIGRAHV